LTPFYQCSLALSSNHWLFFNQSEQSSSVARLFCKHLIPSVNETDNAEKFNEYFIKMAANISEKIKNKNKLNTPC
jgi:hypothetical protein